MEGDEAIVQTVPRILAQSKKAANGASVKKSFPEMKEEIVLCLCKTQDLINSHSETIHS